MTADGQKRGKNTSPKKEKKDSRRNQLFAEKKRGIAAQD